MNTDLIPRDSAKRELIGRLRDDRILRRYVFVLPALCLYLICTGLTLGRVVLIPVTNYLGKHNCIYI